MSQLRDNTIDEIIQEIAKIFKNQHFKTSIIRYLHEYYKNYNIGA